MPLQTDVREKPTTVPAAEGRKTRSYGTTFIILGWLGVLAWAAAIFWLSSRTGPQIEEMNVFEISDKVAHFLAFFAGALPIVCSLRWSTKWGWRKIACVAAFTLMLYGAADEYHQTFTENRSGADVWDGLADTLGGLAGAIVTSSIYARFERSRSPRRAAL
jgi:VanZ family protein